VVLLGLLFVMPSMQAIPTGVGDDNRDFSCGGSCHSDPGLSGESSAIIEMSSDRVEAYSSGLITISVKVSEMELSSKRIVGIFLLSDLHGVADTPQDAGWSILYNDNGGATNFQETRAFDSSEGVTVSWMLRAPAEQGNHTLFAAVHHGGGGVARMAVDEVGISIIVGPVPENLPQIAIGWEPVMIRKIGEDTTLILPVVNATTVQVEWRIGDDGPTETIAASLGQDGWSAVLPMALSDVEFQYRILMSNDDFSESSQWVTLTGEQQEWSTNVWAVRWQMCGIMFAVIGLCIATQRRLAHSLRLPADAMASTLAVAPHATIPADQTDLLMQSAPPPPTLDEIRAMAAANANFVAMDYETLPSATASSTLPSPGSADLLPPPGFESPSAAAETIEPATLALDDPRRPANWNDEQWLYYGHDHINELGGGL